MSERAKNCVRFSPTSELGERDLVIVSDGGDEAGGNRRVPRCQNGSLGQVHASSAPLTQRAKYIEQAHTRKIAYTQAFVWLLDCVGGIVLRLCAEARVQARARQGARGTHSVMEESVFS